MNQVALDAVERWLNRVEPTIGRLTGATCGGRNAGREIAEYQKMLARLQRVLAERLDGERRAERTQGGE